MNKKYEFTDEIINFKDIKLHRIKALVDFDDVRKGDLGGYIESERNLSHNGNSWLYNNAIAYGEVEIYDNAKLYDDVIACGRAKVFNNAQVRNNVIISENAKISGDAKISMNARISGNAIIFGSACISDFVNIYGSASVTGFARISGNVRIYGNSMVSGNAIVSRHTIIFDYAKISENASVTDFARISGNAEILGNAKISEDARISGNATVSENAEIYGEAMIFGKAKIYEASHIYDNAVVYGTVHIRECAKIYGNASICGDSVISGNSKVYGYSQLLNVTVSGKAEIRGYEILARVVIDGDTKIPEVIEEEQKEIEVKIKKDIGSQEELKQVSKLIDEEDEKAKIVSINNVANGPIILFESIKLLEAPKPRKGNIILANKKLFYIYNNNGSLDNMDCYKISTSLKDIFKTENAINLNYENTASLLEDAVLILDKSYKITRTAIDRNIGTLPENTAAFINESVEFLMKPKVKIS